MGETDSSGDLACSLKSSPISFLLVLVVVLGFPTPITQTRTTTSRILNGLTRFQSRSIGHSPLPPLRRQLSAMAATRRMKMIPLRWRGVGVGCPGPEGPPRRLRLLRLPRGDFSLGTSTNYVLYSTH